jgi:hypothetical protein
MKATTIRLPSALKKWVEDQADLNERTIFGQVRYALDLVLEDWQWVRDRELEQLKEAWSTATEIKSDEEIKIETNDDMLSVRIPFSTFNPIAKLAHSLERTANEQVCYLLKLAYENWTTLQERRLQRTAEKKTSEKHPALGKAILVPT